MNAAGKRQKHVHNFSKAYARLQIFNSQYVPKEYKQILINMLHNREKLEKQHDANSSISLEGIDEGISVLENVLRSTITSIEKSYTVLNVAVAFLRRYEMAENYLAIIESYRFESMFDAYMYNAENAPMIPDDHPFALPIKIVLDMAAMLAVNSSKNKADLLLERERKRKESEEFIANNQLLMMNETLRHMEKITKIPVVDTSTSSNDVGKPPSIVKKFCEMKNSIDTVISSAPKQQQHSNSSLVTKTIVKKPEPLPLTTHDHSDNNKIDNSFPQTVTVTQQTESILPSSSPVVPIVIGDKVESLLSASSSSSVINDKQQDDDDPDEEEFSFIYPTPFENEDDNMYSTRPLPDSSNEDEDNDDDDDDDDDELCDKVLALPSTNQPKIYEQSSMTAVATNTTTTKTQSGLVPPITFDYGNVRHFIN